MEEKKPTSHVSFLMEQPMAPLSYYVWDVKGSLGVSSHCISKGILRLIGCACVCTRVHTRVLFFIHGSVAIWVGAGGMLHLELSSKSSLRPSLYTCFHLTHIPRKDPEKPYSLFQREKGRENFGISQKA